jgi:hypothetical protein
LDDDDSLDDDNQNLLAMHASVEWWHCDNPVSHHSHCSRTIPSSDTCEVGSYLVFIVWFEWVECAEKCTVWCSFVVKSRNSRQFVAIQRNSESPVSNYLFLATIQSCYLRC